MAFSPEELHKNREWRIHGCNVPSNDDSLYLHTLKPLVRLLPHSPSQPILPQRRIIGSP